MSTIEPFQRLEFLGFILSEDGRKMSKRWGNVINPDDIVDLVGADSLRVYEMFMGPFENTIAWSKDGLAGACRFLERVNGLSTHYTETGTESTNRQLHKTIKKVAEDIENFKFNTAVSAMMIFVKKAEKNGLSHKMYEQFLKILAPFAPHLAEELWHELGHSDSIHLESFPSFDDSLAVDDIIEIGVQVNGKLRGSITVSPNADEKEVTEIA
ncbi:class I tRNA ligase family protein, partial [Candidatus Kaiserbacteria bacterium]|nr:class I tRNA ligase family protein [Candidatus Kaiserbacteria bacterium]